jgi:hypothetical protein
MEGSIPTNGGVRFAKTYGVDNIHAQDALQSAAIMLLGEALDDIAGLAVDDYIIRRTDREIGSTALASVTDLPPQYDAAYDAAFLERWATTVTVVGWKLAQARKHVLSNVAEELAVHAMIGRAKMHLEMDGLDTDEAVEAVDDLYAEACEDTDFLALYDSDLMPSPRRRKEMGFTDVGFEHWFEPFLDPEHRGVVHPFVLAR